MDRGTSSMWHFCKYTYGYMCIYLNFNGARDKDTGM